MEAGCEEVNDSFQPFDVSRLQLFVNGKEVPNPIKDRAASDELYNRRHEDESYQTPFPVTWQPNMRIVLEGDVNGPRQDFVACPTDLTAFHIGETSATIRVTPGKVGRGLRQTRVIIKLGKKDSDERVEHSLEYDPSAVSLTRSIKGLQPGQFYTFSATTVAETSGGTVRTTTARREGLFQTRKTKQMLDEEAEQEKKERAACEASGSKRKVGQERRGAKTDDGD